MCWKLEADATWHPNDTDGGAFECFCASTMGHDSLSEMGRAAEPWKKLEGKGLSLAAPGWQMSLLSLRGAG